MPTTWVLAEQDAPSLVAERGDGRPGKFSEMSPTAKGKGGLEKSGCRNC